MNQFAAILEWIALGQRVIDAGAKVMFQIRAVLADNGIEADTAALDAVIADAERRRDIAIRDRDGLADHRQSMAQADGSTGD